ncbi:uncharacterized protein [Halyomorpha halys]|uniref:uncharacterized protein n=1 Tax=Halyomorpha halys TaxID=286706 RepID=UPI0006D4DE13|nr:uncharacterized protein LOC106691372 [Halyomorpha halys]
MIIQDDAAISEQLKAFWELEEPGPADRKHPEDVLCEKIFMQTHTRTAEGRYVARLLRKDSSGEPDLNSSIALRRLYSLENKFRRDPRLKEQYIQFMTECEQLGHMSVASTPARYVIPHHGVWQVKPQGTKLRVVFDASNSAGTVSLNDILIWPQASAGP